MKIEKFSIQYVEPQWWEKLFSKYKGGRVYIGPGDYYEDSSGYAWDLIEEDGIFHKFKETMEPLSIILKQTDNYVEYNWSICHMFVRFVDDTDVMTFKLMQS